MGSPAPTAQFSSILLHHSHAFVSSLEGLTGRFFLSVCLRQDAALVEKKCKEPVSSKTGSFSMNAW
jgi:hypothetical protein